MEWARISPGCRSGGYYASCGRWHAVLVCHVRPKIDSYPQWTGKKLQASANPSRASVLQERIEESGYSPEHTVQQNGFPCVMVLSWQRMFLCGCALHNSTQTGLTELCLINSNE